MTKQTDAESAPSTSSIAQQAPPESAPLSEDWAVDMLRRIIRWQFEDIKMKPSKTKTAANRRAHEARSVSELVNTITKLDAVERRREGKGRKVKPRDDSNIREEFIRRLDQLLAATRQTALPEKSDPERD